MSKADQLIEAVLNGEDSRTLVELDVGKEMSDFNKEVTNESKAGLTLVQAKIKSVGGYKYKTYKQSASMEWEWKKPESTVTIDGWHGKGGYGPGMMFFNLYHNGRPLIEMAPPTSLDKVDIDTYRKHVKAIVKKVAEIA